MSAGRTGAKGGKVGPLIYIPGLLPSNGEIQRLWINDDLVFDAAETSNLRRALVDLIEIYEGPRGHGWGVEEVLRLEEIRQLARRALVPRLQQIRKAISGQMSDNVRAKVKTKDRELLPRAKRRRHKKRRTRSSGGGE